ncbi:MAG: hypothetical protein KAT68_19620 [Bacteroidales bacterium]|nr:hypothetical protein [Bacteroidales bacterium]
MRKQAQRLADEAVRQYAISKNKAEKRIMLVTEKLKLDEEVINIRKLSKSEWTAEMRAKVKALEDNAYWEQCNYNYGDDEI